MSAGYLVEERPAGRSSDEARPIRRIGLLTPEDPIVDLDAAIAALGIVLYRYTGATPVVFELTATSASNVAAWRSEVTLNVAGADTLASLTAAVSSVVPEKARMASCVTCIVPRDLSRFLRIERAGNQRQESLNVVFSPAGQALLQYGADIYDEERVAQLAKHIERVLKAAREPKRPVSELPMISAQELNQILVGFNCAGPESEPTTIPDAFEAQVNRIPDAPALKFGAEVITYRGLYERAVRVAGALQQNGVGVESLVGVFMDDPIAVAIAYFGIVIAGGVLVPLDPEWPRDRLHAVIRNAEPRVIVTAGKLAVDLPPDSPPQLSYDDFDRNSTAWSFTRPALTPDNAAYVVHTSGSTGLPKGVIGLHRTIPSAVAVALPMAEDEVFAVGANLAFGAGVIGLFHALIQGAGIFLVSAQLSRDLSRLVDAWERAAVTRVVMAAPQLRQLCMLDGIRHRLKNLRTISHAGSALSTDLLPTIYEAFPQATLVNSYTSIEVGTAISRWVSPPSKRRHSLSVGPILSNIRVYILSPDGNLMPLGMPGEIYVSSADLSRGYLNQPELTRQRFLPNQFPTPGMPRVYRTGDIGRLLQNGDLEYLGRLDNQVKVRGMRVELEEIELFLHRHQDVHHVAVVAVAQENDCRLTAFVTPKPGRTLSVSVLRGHLTSGLPYYCVPALFIIADQLPMTRNGKIDRQNLPKIGPTRPEIETPFVPPRNPAEAGVQATWERELGFEGIGVNDNFLELGGDSLMAVRISVALQEQFSMEVPVIALFEHLTIADLTEHLAFTLHADASQ